MPQAAAPTVETALAPDHIDATLNDIIDDGSEVFTIVAGPGGTDTRSGGTADPRRVTIHNGRPHAKDFVLERHGFRFVCHDTKVEDFYDEDQIRRVYYPEMEALIKSESGAKRVVVFDHTLRTADDEIRESKRTQRSSAVFTTTTRNGRPPSACAIFSLTKPKSCCSGASASSRFGVRSAILWRLIRLPWRMRKRCRRRI